MAAITMSNFVCYDIPVSELQPKPSDESSSVTQLPITVVVQRIAFAAMFVVKGVLEGGFIGAVIAILGSAFALYTLYKHVLQQDRLVEAFYQAAGGKENYEQLPEVKIDTQWDTLTAPLSRAKTEDGRKVLIVKGLSAEAKRPTLAGFELTNAPKKFTQKKFVFIEKIKPEDTEGAPKNLSEKVMNFYHGFGHTYHKMIRASGGAKSLGNASPATEHLVTGVMEGRLLNELVHQLTTQPVEIVGRLNPT